MRVSQNAMKQSRQFTRSMGQAVVPFTRQDLTKRWMGRIQSKAKDSHSQETYMKLNSLIDYYNKPAEEYNQVNIIYLNKYTYIKIYNITKPIRKSIGNTGTKPLDHQV